MSKNKLSIFLSLILRHKPETIGVTLDEYGWVDIDELVSKSDRFTRENIMEIVNSDRKTRYRIDSSGKRIRANQGHSVKIKHDFEEKAPPAILYHGTSREVLDLIQKSGLKRMKRHHVHLSADIKTAEMVGNRRNTELVILKVDAKAMHEEGIAFYVSENGVWLTDYVAPKFLKESA